MDQYRSASLFQPHRARQALRDAHSKKIPPLLGAAVGFNDQQFTRLLAPLGYDWVWIDPEHSPCDVEKMTSLIHDVMFMSEGKTMPIVRIPGHDHAWIGYALDAGASIMVPQVDTPEQARHIMSAAKFGANNRGTRSFPPFRWLPGMTDTRLDATKTFCENLNEQGAVMIQIESMEGVNNIDAILDAEPDIDGVWCGTLDLRISMGLDGNMGQGTEPEFVAAVAKVKASARAHGRAYGGFYLGPAGTMKAAVEHLGFDYVLMDGDAVAILGMAAKLAEARKISWLKN